MPGAILPPRLTRKPGRGPPGLILVGIIGWPPCQNFIDLTHISMVHIRVTLSHFLEKNLKY